MIIQAHGIFHYEMLLVVNTLVRRGGGARFLPDDQMTWKELNVCETEGYVFDSPFKEGSRVGRESAHRRVTILSNWENGQRGRKKLSSKMIGREPQKWAFANNPVQTLDPESYRTRPHARIMHSEGFIIRRLALER